MMANGHVLLVILYQAQARARQRAHYSKCLMRIQRIYVKIIHHIKNFLQAYNWIKLKARVVIFSPVQCTYVNLKTQIDTISTRFCKGSRKEKLFSWWPGHLGLSGHRNIFPYIKKGLFSLVAHPFSPHPLS